MKQLRNLSVWPWFAMSLVACAPHENASGPVSVASGVVHGRVANEHNKMGRSTVALVSKLDQGQALCTGTIVAKDLVLTAAHCVESNPEKIVVVFADDVQKSQASDRREVDAFVQHPSWNPGAAGAGGDLAVVHFSGGIPRGYTPVQLVKSDFHLNVGERVQMIGFGVSSGVEHSGAGRLRQMQTEVVANLSGHRVETDGRKSSVCFGDSGGPAFTEKNGHLLQWGVASSVTSKACNQASIHTEVAPYISWIKDVAKQLRKP